MQECGICYYETKPENVFSLACCQDRNLMCVACLHLLLTPICPFCRKPIVNLPPSYSNSSSLFTSNATSLPETRSVPSSFLHLIDPSDDTLVSSRSLRRRMKRMRKVQERERQAEYNRQLNIVLNESKRMATLHQQQRRNIQSVIRQDHDIFRFDP